MGLEVFFDVAAAFEEEVSIDGALLVDGDELAKFPGGEFGADGLDLDAGAGVDGDGGLDEIGGGEVAELFERDAGQEEVAFLEAEADAFEAAGEALFGEVLGAEEAPGALPMGGANQAGGRALGIAGDDRGGEAGALAGVDLKLNLDLLGEGVVGEARFYGGAVEAIGAEGVEDALGGFDEVVFGEGLAEFELGGVDELSFRGRVRGPGDGDAPDEPGGDGAIGEVDFAGGREDGIDGEVVVAADIEKGLDGAGDGVNGEGVAGLDGVEPLEVGAGVGLGFGFVANAGYTTALVGGIRRLGFGVRGQSGPP